MVTYLVSCSSRKSTDSKEPKFKSYILTMDTGDQEQPQQQQQLHSHHGHHRERGSGRGSARPSPACSPVSSMDVDVLEPCQDSQLAASNYHHNQHHKHKVDPWDTLVGGGEGGGGGGQNSISVAASVAAAPSSSFSTLPSLKVQCVWPDSSEEESGHPSSHGSTLQRLRTEPFTPRLLEEVSDEEEREGSAFEESVQAPPGAPPRLSPNVLGSSAGLGRNSQHIPAVDGMNHSTSGSSTAKHKASHQATTVVSPATSSASPMDVTSVCVSRTGGVTSTTGNGGASISSGERDAQASSGGGAERTSQLLTPHGSRRSSGGSGGGGSGSISCVNSSGVSGISSGVAVSSVIVSQTNVTVSVSASSTASSSQSLRWEMRSRTERGDRASPKAFPVVDLFSAEKSDSSASSPLRMDIEENVSSSPRSDHDNESRSSCPKVPPLKIILPSQKVSTTPHAPDQSKNPLTKPALPYVLNPTQSASAGEWVPEMTDSDEGVKVQAPSTAQQEEDLLHINTPSPSRPSRPSSRAGSSDRDESRNSAKRPALESSPLLKDGAAGSGREDEDGNGEKQGEDEKGEETRPTRTLRSHTAMKQQQEQKQQKGGVGKVESVKEAQDRGSKADAKGWLAYKVFCEPSC